MTELISPDSSSILRISREGQLPNGSTQLDLNEVELEERRAGLLYQWSEKVNKGRRVLLEAGWEYPTTDSARLIKTRNRLSWTKSVARSKTDPYLFHMTFLQAIGLLSASRCLVTILREASGAPSMSPAAAVPSNFQRWHQPKVPSSWALAELRPWQLEVNEMIQEPTNNTGIWLLPLKHTPGEAKIPSSSISWRPRMTCSSTLSTCNVEAKQIQVVIEIQDVSKQTRAMCYRLPRADPHNACFYEVLGAVAPETHVVVAATRSGRTCVFYQTAAGGYSNGTTEQHPTSSSRTAILEGALASERCK